MAKAKAKAKTVDRSIYISAAEVLNMALKGQIAEATGQRVGSNWPPHIIDHVNDEIAKANSDGFAKAEEQQKKVAALREWTVDNVWTPPAPPEPKAEEDEEAQQTQDQEQEG